MTNTEHPFINSAPVALIDTVIWDIYLRLRGSAQHGWTLFWSDCVANDWSEHYRDLSVALCRAGALMRCGESGWARGFSAYDGNDGPLFTDRAAYFLDGVTE